MAATKPADLVRRYMEQARLSQRAMARLAGVSQGHLSKVLRGTAPIGTAVTRKLMAALPAHLALGSGKPGPTERQVLATVRRIVRSSASLMHLVADLMHSVDRNFKSAIPASPQPPAPSSTRQKKSR